MLSAIYFLSFDDGLRRFFLRCINFGIFFKSYSTLKSYKKKSSLTDRCCFLFLFSLLLSKTKPICHYISAIIPAIIFGCFNLCKALQYYKQPWMKDKLKAFTSLSDYCFYACSAALTLNQANNFGSSTKKISDSHMSYGYTLNVITITRRGFNDHY